MKSSKSSLMTLPRKFKTRRSQVSKFLRHLVRSWEGHGVDTLKDARYSKMKELRFDAADGVWRIVFAFDPRRRAILLCGGDKSGVSEGRFYRGLIATADKRYAAHLAEI